jgi:hypothetical protein
MTERDDKIWHFAESSKLLLAKVELKWSPQDLYCLVMQQLANSRVGEDLRSHSLDLRWQPVDNVYPVPVRLASGQVQLLRSMVEALAGPWMGKDKKRGYTFTWIPTHLSDAQGRLSPRSILLAFQRAAEWTESNRPDYPLPLHYEGLHAGVVDASTNRVNELREDYPWVPPLLDALHGTSVPLTVNDLLTRWTEPVRSETLHAAREWQRLPPRRYSLTPSDPQALLADLVSLAVLYETSDARYNMPDIFRVGFGIKRRGGVKPPA